MKYNYLKKLPFKERQKFLGPDWNKKYFQGRYLFFVLLIVAITVFNSLLAIICEKGFLVILLCDVIGLPMFIVTHISIISGFISTNTGSYFRETEPIRYWFNTTLPLIGYVFSQIFFWQL